MAASPPTWTRPTWTRDLALGAGMLLTGVGFGLLAHPSVGDVSLLTGVTGVLLVLAFRIHEGRAARQEARIAEMTERERSLSAANARLEAAFHGLSETMAAALEAPGRPAPRRRVWELAVELGREMHWSEEDIPGLRAAAVLHDIGDLLPPDVWNRPGPLTDEEWAGVRALPGEAAALLEPAKLPWPVVHMVRAHHERWDGTGYPDGRRGEGIPAGARILAVADAYHAMTTPRPYRTALGHREALEAIRRESGRGYDPAVVAALCALAGRADFLERFAPCGETEEVSEEDLPKTEKPGSVVAAGPSGADERI